MSQSEIMPQPTKYTSRKTMEGGARRLAASVRGFTANADEFLSIRMRENLKGRGYE